MVDFEDVVEKIKTILSKESGGKKILDKDVAKALGINQLTFATMKNRNKIPFNEILDFCASKKISINWLLYDQFLQSLVVETEKFENVRYFRDVYASAGAGGEAYEGEIEYLKIDLSIVEAMGGAKELKHIEAITITGDSMEPTLHDGTIVFVHRKPTIVGKNGIYVVLAESQLYIKRINAMTEDSILLLSDNAKYPPLKFHHGTYEVVGKVVGSFE